MDNAIYGLGAGALLCLVFTGLVLIHLHYFRKTSASHLKFSAAAMAAQMVVVLSYAASNYLPEAVLPWSMTWLAELVSAVMIFAAACHIAGHKVPIPLVVAALITGLVPSLLFAVMAEAPPPVTTTFIAMSAAAALPPGLLIVYSLVMMMALIRDSVALMGLAALTMLHVCARIFLPMLGIDQLVTQVTLSTLYVLVGVMLLAVAIEELLSRVSASDREVMRLEQDRKRLSLQFEQTDRLGGLGVMAGSIAHDLNSMLTSILGYAGLVLRKLPEDAEARDELFMVMSGARQAQDLTSRILSSSGRGAMDFAGLDLARVTDEMSATIDAVVPRHISITRAVARNLPVVKGDKAMLGQALLQLISNAVERIESAGLPSAVLEIRTGITDLTTRDVSLGVFSEQDYEAGTYVYMGVKDTAGDVDERAFEKMLDPFASLSGIIRQHRGFVRVESGGDIAGVTIGIYFPVMAFSDPDVSGGESESSGDESAPWVLLADDDVRISGLIEHILAAEGYNVDTVADGAAAIDKVKLDGHRYSLFLLDCTMPKVSGPEVLRAVRERRGSVPVLLMSGYHQEQVMNDISRDDFADFLHKPFSVDQILLSVRQLVSRSGLYERKTE